MSLVDVVDEVLDLLEADERMRFTLDGQLATVDDYLAIRPEAEPRIRALADSGRLAIGPWQILMDEFLVSGESIARNLETGLARAAELGGTMRVGYLPDMFGHVAQMPQILRRAGIEQAVVWRGVPAAIERHAFLWEAPDGSAVRAEYLPDGYGNAARLIDGGGVAEVEILAEALRPWFGDDPPLGMVGTDHTPPARDLADRIEGRARISTLAEYLDGASGDALTRWSGELRSAARANLLPNVVSARIDLKAACARAERALERYAEPLQALHGGGRPEPFLREAWKRMLQNSAHDSICGCSADEVSAQVLVRYAEAEQIARELAGRAVAEVAGRVPHGAVVVVNPSPRARVDLVELDLAVPDDWDAVALELPDGSHAPTQEVARRDPLLYETTLRGAELAERLGRRIHGRELFGRVLNAVRVDSPRLTLEVSDEPDPAWLDVDALVREIGRAGTAAPDDAWQVRIVAGPRRTVAARVPAPPLGWTSVRSVHGKGEPPAGAEVDGTVLRNGLVTFDAAGLRLLDGGDFGDSYNYAPPAEDTVVSVPDRVRLRRAETGPLRARLVVEARYSWSRRVEADGARRSAETVPVEVETHAELRAGEPFVRIRIAFDNPCSDHRLRIHVPLPERAETTLAEGQFAVVERGEPEGGYGEAPLATYPAHGFVAAGGLALLLDHVTEYELVDGAELALTILRSIGLISRAANPYREDPAGPELPIPAAQMRGPQSFSFAVLPGGADALARLEDYRLPFLTSPGTGAAAELGAATGLELCGEDVVLSSLRRVDGRLVARLVNERPAAGRVTVAGREFELGPWEIRATEVAS